MISNSDPGYFRALIPFERDPLPPAAPASDLSEASGVRHRDLPPQSRGDGSAQPPDSGSTSGGGCAEEFYSVSNPTGQRSWVRDYFLSQIEPLERV